MNENDLKLPEPTVTKVSARSLLDFWSEAANKVSLVRYCRSHDGLDVGESADAVTGGFAKDLLGVLQRLATAQEMLGGAEALRAEVEKTEHFKEAEGTQPEGKHRRDYVLRSPEKWKKFVEGVFTIDKDGFNAVGFENLLL